MDTGLHITGTDVIEAARKYLEVPFHHQGRAREAGLDCIGLLVVVAEDLGIPVEDCAVYKRYPSPADLMKHLRAKLEEQPTYMAEVGDVLVFWWNKKDREQHVGFFTGRTLIHTFAKAKRVTEEPFSDFWIQRWMHTFRLKGVC
jgi:cell wall-associated NlpC family hydrolase